MLLMTPLQLLRVGNHQHILIQIIKIGQTDSLRLQLIAQLLHTVLEIIRHMDLGEGVGNPVGVDLGIKGQLIDQPVHLIGLIVDRVDIAVHSSPACPPPRP